MTKKIEAIEFQREKRTLQLSIVSMIMYGIVSLTSGGPFAFFPINELMFFGVVSYFVFFNFKKSKISYLLFILFSGLALLRNQLFLGFFISNLQISNFLNQPIIRFLPYAIFSLMLIEMLRFFIQTKWKIAAFPIIIAFFIVGTYFNIYTFQTLSLLLFVFIGGFYFQRHQEGDLRYSKSLYFLWILILFLKLSTLLSMYLYGFDIDF